MWKPRISGSARYSLCVFPPCFLWEVAFQMQGNVCKQLAARRLLNVDETWDFCDFLGNVRFLLKKRSRCQDLSIHHQVGQNNLPYRELKDRGPTCIKHSNFLFQGKHRQCIKSCWVHTVLLLWSAGVLHWSALCGYQKPWNFTKLFNLQSSTLIDSYDVV